MILSVATKEGSAEFEYKRKRIHAEGQTPNTTICVTFSDEDGIPTGADMMAKVMDGEWKVFELEGLENVSAGAFEKA